MKSENSSISEDTKQPFFKRYKWWILILISSLIVIAAVLLIVFLYVLPQQKSSNLYKDNTSIVKDGLIGKPDLSIIPQDILDDIDDSKKCNEYTPPLNEPFDYKKYKIRGVNLGGWLVPEPFIVPSIFEDKVNKGVVDEWTLCELIGKKECSKRLLEHYDTFVTEQDIKRIQILGLNHVRIPIGYWMIDINEDEPFIYGSWKYLLKAINWCRKYGLRVMIDFHGAPGSQNGWNHSGRLGEIRFLNSNNTDSVDYVKRFQQIVADVVNYFSKKEFQNVVTQIGVLNEPAIYKTNQADTIEFYKDTYNLLRTNATNDDKLLVFHEGFLGLNKWYNTLPSSEFKQVSIDSHNYIIFDNNLITKPLNEINNLPCQVWKKDFETSMQNFGMTMCGEFSVATNDCGKWLNGIKLGSRYDGTYETEEPACNTCTCKGSDDYKSYSKDKINYLLTFAEKQMDAFESGIGWFFWNFKTENNVNPSWDYFLGVDQGWIPKDANNRKNKC